MRRPLDWFVFFLSIAFLLANVSLGRRPALPGNQGVAPVTAAMDFSHVIVEDPNPPQFGYVRDDGSFVPLAQQNDDDTETVRSPWSQATSAASKVPERF